MCKIVNENGMIEEGDPRNLGYGEVSQTLFEQEEEENFDRTMGHLVDPESLHFLLRGVKEGSIRVNRELFEPSGSEISENEGVVFPDRKSLLKSLGKEDKNVFERRMNLLETLSREEKKIILHRNN